MWMKMTAMCLAGAAAALAAGAAAAGTCYMVLDRSDNVVYRGPFPPIDLSERGQADRDAMRRRGEHLIAMEVDRCPVLQFLMGDAGGQRLDFDQTSDGTVPRAAKVPPKDASRGTAPSKRAASATSAPTRPASSAKPVDKREATQN